MAQDSNPYTLYAHQGQTLEPACKGSYGIFAGCGTGKTLIGIELAKYFKAHPIHSGRTLVVAPLSLVHTAWADDLKKFAPELKAASVWAKTPKQREKVLAAATGADVVVVNYESFGKIFAWAKKQGFDVLLLDESSRAKDHRAKITKMLTIFSRSIPRVYPMSGTPMPNNAMEIYPQMDMVKPGLLGSDFWQFRAAYFKPWGQVGNRIFDWRPLPGSVEAIMKKIRPHATFIKKEDCLDLPAKTFEVRKVFMPDDLREAYETMVEEKVLPLLDGTQVLSVSAIAEIMKLREITSGFIVDARGKTHQLSAYKVNLLQEVLEEIGQNQAIIWAQFRRDISEIKEALGDKAVLAWGGMNPSDLVGNVDAFKAGKAQYLIAHPKTVGHGTTLTNCNYAVYFSLSYSHEEFAQSQDRIHRIGTRWPCTYIMLLAENSIDEIIYRALIRKEAMSNAALNHLREKARKTQRHGQRAAHL